jgi:deoxycytidylate deaminase
MNDKKFCIGQGYNSMPCDLQTECFKDGLAPTFKSDKTCCIHAEQRAITDALKNHEDLTGSSLYFIRLDDNDQPKHSGEPYCSICSKMALDVGIAYFHLWRKEGWVRYEAKEYNDITFQYK